jgi:hypothetical protein
VSWLHSLLVLAILTTSVLFSAIVLQWITSRDNASSAHKSEPSSYIQDASSNLRTCTGNRSCQPPQVRSHSFSPHALSAKPVMDDVAEISLDNIDRSSSSDDVAGLRTSVYPSSVYPEEHGGKIHDDQEAKAQDALRRLSTSGTDR